MTIETIRDSLCINQIVEQRKDSFIIEGDAIIPDVKPDILGTISTSGTVCIYKKEIQDGKIKIDGTINTYIMYLADSESNNIRSINTNLDFSQTINTEKAKINMNLENTFTLKEIECKVLNGRKVNIKAVLEVETKMFSNENIDIVKGVEDLRDVQTLNNNININTLIGEGSTKVYAKDTFSIDNIDNLAEVMKSDIRIINKESKISYNKVLVKSDLEVKVLYLTEDNRINTLQKTIPVMGFVDIKDVNDESLCNIKYEVRNVLIKPNNVEEHSIYVEVELEIYCQAYENRQLDIIQDLYSPTIDLTFEQKRIKVMQKKDCIQNVCNIREKQTIPEIGNNKLYDVEVTPIINNQKILNDRIMYDGEVSLNFIFASNTQGGINTKKVNIPFNFNIDANGIVPTSNINTNIEIGMQDFIVMPDESIDIKVDLNFSVEYSKNLDINIIENIQPGENRATNPYSMTIYFVKPGDSLWKIAKKFRTTVENIAGVNGIEKIDKINIGQQLFIPRYNG